MKLALPLDKQAHVLAGYAIAATVAPFGLWWALAVATVLGAAKEWVHVSTHAPMLATNRVLTITDAGPVVGIHDLA